MSSFSHLCVLGLQMRFGRGGGWGGEAGFSAAQLAKARAQPQRANALVGDPVRSGRNNDSCVWARKNKQKQQTEADPYGMTNKKSNCTSNLWGGFSGG